MSSPKFKWQAQSVYKYCSAPCVPKCMHVIMQSSNHKSKKSRPIFTVPDISQSLFQDGEMFSRFAFKTERHSKTCKFFKLSCDLGIESRSPKSGMTDVWSLMRVGGGGTILQNITKICGAASKKSQR